MPRHGSPKLKALEYEIIIAYVRIQESTSHVSGLPLMSRLGTGTSYPEWNFEGPSAETGYRIRRRRRVPASPVIPLINNNRPDGSGITAVVPVTSMLKSAEPRLNEAESVPPPVISNDPA